MAVMNWFSTQVLQAPLLQKHPRLLKELRDDIESLIDKDLEGQAWSKINYPNGYTSYSSIDQLHKFTSSFDDLAKRLKKPLALMISKTGLDLKSESLYLSRMWANAMGPGGMHSYHMHPLSVISGTVYIDLPKGSSGIKFEDPRMQSFMARPALKERAQKSQQNFIELSPRTGDLVLFESWLKHEVPVNKQNRTRLSISFNYDLK